jgi:DNA polymerase III epsilon subunit-like protein
MLVVDVESSGLVASVHSILSVGAFDIEKPEVRFYKECRVWDGAHVSKEALEVNGFTEDECRTGRMYRVPGAEKGIETEAITEAELITQFLEWSQQLGDRTIAGQNPSFDRDMLRAAALRAGLSWDLAHRTIDSHTLCFMHMVKRAVVPPLDKQHRRSALDLDAVLVYCGIPAEPEPHNALTGALCHGEVISRLLYDTKLLPEFTQFDIPWLK